MRHIDDFTIHRFRGMKEARLEKPGQINLLVGGNNSGKTSMLEAISLFRDPLNPLNWSSLASARETGSLRSSTLSDRLVWLFPHKGLYPQEDLSPGEKLSPREDKTELSFSASGTFPQRNVVAYYDRFTEVVKEPVPRYAVEDDIGRSGVPTFEEREREVEGVNIKVNISLSNNGNTTQRELLTETYEFRDYGMLPKESESARELRPYPARSINGCTHRSSGIPPELWTDVIYAEAKKQTIELLRLFDPDIQDIDIVLLRGRASSISIKHRKLGRAPLSAFGDGLRRVFTLASAIPGARDGLLLIDELEIAVHTRMLEETFSWLIEFCHQYNVQVFATTHSLEAIDAIIEACKNKEVDLAGYHLQRGDEEVDVKRFDKGLMTRLREDLGLDVR